MTSHSSIPAQVLLVRHGETALNTAGRLRGLLDPPLTPRGIEQVRALAHQLAQRRPSRIVTGPLQRTLQTAKLLAQEVDLEPIIDDDLQDRDYGPWAGQTELDVASSWGSVDAAPDVEPATCVRDRALRSLSAQILFLSRQPIVMVTHDAVIKQLLAALDPTLGPPENIPQRTACFNELHYQDGHWAVISVDQVPALTSPRTAGNQPEHNG